MIEGYLPGLVRVDPVGVAPAEVVAQALRCELLEAVAEAAARVCALAEVDGYVTWREWEVLRAALVAAGATGKAGT